MLISSLLKKTAFFGVFFGALFFTPFLIKAADNIFYFSTQNDSEVILIDSSGRELGHDGNNIFEEISDSAVFLQGDFLGLQIEDIADGEYQINLENRDVFEQTNLVFLSAEQAVDQDAYFLLNNKNQIIFSVQNGQLELGPNYSLVSKLRLNKTDWRLSWEDSEVNTFRIYGREENENYFEYLDEIDGFEYFLTGGEQNFQEYAVTRVLKSNPHQESGIFPSVLGGVVSVDDADEDGLADEWEDILGTDKNSTDSDGDGLEDLDELSDDTDPLVSDKKPSGKSGPIRQSESSEETEDEPEESEETIEEDTTPNTPTQEENEFEEPIEEVIVEDTDILSEEEGLEEEPAEEEAVGEEEPELIIESEPQPEPELDETPVPTIPLSNQQATVLNTSGNNFIQNIFEFFQIIFSALGCALRKLFYLLIQLI